MESHTLKLPGGRVLEYFDERRTGSDATGVVFYHHGTPNIGEPPGPLLEVANDRGLEWVSLSRPGYAGSDRVEGRRVVDVASDVEAVADHLGLDRFAVFGHSGGGPHALACAAVLGDRISAVVSIAGMAPPDAEGLEWYSGMYPGGEQELRAALDGTKTLTALLEANEFDPLMFTEADMAMLAGGWGWFNNVVESALRGGLDGMIDDDVAYVNPWGFDLSTVKSPVLLLHGAEDRVVPVSHSTWLAEHLPNAELWSEAEESHLSVMRRAVDALDWIVPHTREDSSS